MINITNVRVVARDKVIADFSEDVLVDTFYSSAANYTVTSSIGEVRVTRVVIPNNKDFVSYVILVLSPQVDNEDYTVDVVTLRDRLGAYYTPAGFSWTYQRTKVDSTLASFPRMYDLSASSNLRAMVEAIAMEDNRIAGFAGISLGSAANGVSVLYDGFPAGGDLFGFYPNPGVDGMQGRFVSPAVPADGDVMTWDATNNWWVPSGSVGVVSVIDSSSNNVIDALGNTVTQ